MEMWVNEFWLFLTAVIFTIIGWYWGFKSNTIGIIESTIDSLIEDGYLKTKSTNNENEIDIVKWRDWCKEE